MSDETNLYFNLDDEDNEKRVVVRVSELVRCLKHFRESLLCNGGDYEHDMREIGGHLKAATLGGGTLTAEQVREAIEANSWAETSTIREFSDSSWQAIADELNDMLGSDNEYEAKMDELLYYLTNGKFSKSRQYSLDFMKACVDEEYEDAYNELNAERGSGTCELHDCDGSFSAVNRPVWRCDCGAFMTQYTDATTYHKPRFCPNCGARTRKAVKR